MDISESLDALAEVIGAAKPRALGGGAIIDKDAAVQLLDQARASVPDEVRQAQGVLAERDIVIANAHAEADQIRGSARAEADRMVAEDEVTLAADVEARRIIGEAQADADAKRAQVDAYVDAKLAAFEGSLQRTLETVAHGRQKLAGQWMEEAYDQASES